MKKNRSKWLLIFSFVLLTGSCNKQKEYNEYDAKAAGKEYCECMKKYHSDVDIANALVVCDAHLNIKTDFSG